MAKINNFDEANDKLLTVEENYAADKHSPIRGWNVENLHYNWIFTRQLDSPSTGSDEIEI